MSNGRGRKPLREWVMNHYGDGRRVPCAGCGLMLERRFLTLDRYPIPGFMGGTYRRGNVRPMCGPCNHSNRHNPTREWVQAYAAANGIKLRGRRCPQYSRRWYEQNKELIHGSRMTQTVAESCAPPAP